MSGSLPVDVYLRPRLGQYYTPRRQTAPLGTTVRIYVDVLNRLTSLPYAGATGASGIWWSPLALPPESQGQPATVIEIEPGVLAFDVPADLPGTYVAWCGIGGPTVETVWIRFDVPADGAPPQIAEVWTGLQAVAAAAGASAGRAEAILKADEIATEVSQEVARSVVTELVSQRPPKVITSRQYRLLAEDAGATLVFMSSAPTWVDVPLGLPAGFQALLVMGGVAPIRINPLAGVSIPISSGHNGVATRNAGASLLATGGDTFILFGTTADVTPAYEPVFSFPPALPNFAFGVSEAAAGGTVVGRIEARGAGPITLQITGGNDGNRFALSSISEGIADLLVAGPLDFETTPSYALQIEARNSKGAAGATVQITITDVPPVAPRAGQIFGVDESSPNDTVVGVVQVTEGRSAEAFAIVPGASSALFGIDSSGALTKQGTLSYEAAPRHILGIAATDHEGTSAPVPVTVAVVKPPLTYAPISDGAWSYWQPNEASSITIGGGGVQEMRDLGARGLNWLADVDTDTYPLPVLQTGSSGIAGRSVINASGQSRLNGNALLLDAARDAAFLAFEGVLSFTDVVASSDIFNLSRNQDRSARFNLALSIAGGIPTLRLVTRRLDSDAGLTHASTVRIYPATTIYVYAAADWETGQTTLQVNTVSEVQTSPWTSGYGRTEDLSSKWATLGYGGNASARLRFAEAALWRSRPTADLLAENRVALAARYGIT